MQTLNLDDIKQGIIADLRAQLKMIQAHTCKKLVMGDVVEESICDELYDVVLRLKYAGSGRKYRACLTFTYSESFNMAKEQFQAMAKTAPPKFKEFVSSIRSELGA